MRFLSRLHHAARWSLAMVVVLAVLALGTTDHQGWLGLRQASNRWLTAFSELFSFADRIPIVSAGEIDDALKNWKNWPKSIKHKDFDGGWVLPFEIFQQQYYRGNQRKNRPPEYRDYPVSIDINGDGLQDLVYSKGEVGYSSLDNGEFVRNGELEQFIILRRSNGFQLVYTCHQNQETQQGAAGQQVKVHYYYGDCADTSYTGHEPGFRALWTPATFWYHQARLWDNDDQQMIGQNTSEYYGFNQPIFDYAYVDANLNGAPVETFDRFIPKLMDMNGDGLIDVVFFGQTDIGRVNNANSATSFAELNFILYNNGHGFDLGGACVSRFPNWQDYPYHISSPNYQYNFNNPLQDVEVQHQPEQGSNYYCF